MTVRGQSLEQKARSSLWLTKSRILGASILAPQAGEMIQPWILAISKKMKIAAMASYIAPYPTYGEASKRAAGACLRHLYFLTAPNVLSAFTASSFLRCGCNPFLHNKGGSVKTSHNAAVAQW